MNKFEEMKELRVDLASIGGREVTIEDMVREIRVSRRERFFNLLLSIEEGEEGPSTCFDAIGFLAATENFGYSFMPNETNYEGTIHYEVTVGNDCVWKCKTEISWKAIIPTAFGHMSYKTEVVPNENVKANRINALNGTLQSIRVIKKDLKILDRMEAYERSKAACLR